VGTEIASWEWKGTVGINKKLSRRKESMHLTLLCCTVQKAFQYVEAFGCGSRVWQIDRRTACSR